MSRCPLCNGNPYAPVRRRWTLRLPMDTPSQNAFKGMNRFVYKRIRDDFESLIRSEMSRYKIPKADGFRRIRLARRMGKGKRLYDHANLVGGAKPVIDACVRAGLLVDDKPKHFRGYYRQARGAGVPGTELQVEEVEA